SDEKSKVKPPIDQLDGACKDHDICYGKCGTDFPCDPSARSKCFRACDEILTRQAYAIGGFWGNTIGAAIDRPGKRDPGPNAGCCGTTPSDGLIATSSRNGANQFFDWRRQR
ncbi:MAG TPA: hypothetical protein VM260_10925, partial [Pirellula sp.]|nr:hypothetical protein [Pirellula sp.]